MSLVHVGYAWDLGNIRRVREADAYAARSLNFEPYNDESQAFSFLSLLAVFYDPYSYV